MRRLAGLLFLLALTGFGPAFGSDTDAAAQGAELLQPFKQQLQAALKAGLAESPVAAIDVCKLRAPAIAAGLTLDTASVGRSSHKLRNPANAPAPWMQEAIDHYLTQPSDLEPVTVQLEDGRIGYAEPIVTQPVCLLCHGENLSPVVVTKLEQLYPADQATGFRAGDFRGIFWAEFAAD
jgi:hypothetical protein